MKGIIVIIIVSIFAFSRCASSTDPKLLIGKYAFNRLNYSTKDSIFIYPNGTYEHQYISTNGQIFKSGGLWSYDTRGEILFQDFIFFNNKGPEDLPPGNWHSSVEFEDDEVKLIYSSEDNIYFSKENSPR